MAPRRSKKGTTTTILLVRHGKTATTGTLLPGRAPGLHLSDVGKAQAATVADALATYRPTPSAIYASPLDRTKETAAPIAKAFGLRVRTQRFLLELDIGEWTGMALKDAARLDAWRTVQRFPSTFRFPGGESFNELSARVTDGLRGLVDEHRGEVVVCVSHADTIRAAVAVAAGIPLDLFQRLIVSPCSISAISYHSGGPSVLCVNQSAEGVPVQ